MPQGVKVQVLSRAPKQKGPVLDLFVFLRKMYMITDKPYPLERRLFGYVISQDPVSLGVEYAQVSPNHLGLRAGEMLTAEADPSGEIFGESQSSLLHAGIQDTYTFYDSILNSRIHREQREAIASHPITRKNLIGAAMHNYISIDARLGRSLHVDNAYVLSEGEDFIRISRPNTNLPGEGCPFVGNNTHRQVDPLFERFGRWATKFVFSHYEASRLIDESTTAGAWRMWPRRSLVPLRASFQAPRYTAC